MKSKSSYNRKPKAMQVHRFLLFTIMAALTFAALPNGLAFAQEGHEGHDHGKAENMSKEKPKLGKKANKSVYTCPMHPQIRTPEEGRCPICGMELVLAAAEESASGGSHEGLSISPASRRLAGIKTLVVESAPLFKKVRAVGNINFDESRLSTIPAYVGGRIEKLYADYTGVSVKKGDHLAVVYSPNLYSAQVEYIQSMKTIKRMAGSKISTVRNTQKKLLENARTKLRELGMSDIQIKKIEKTKKPESRLEIYAPIGGTVISKPASQGQYLKAGQTIFRIADLSSVWLMIDVFPEDANYIKYGQKVEATIRSASGKVFTGRVSFVDPVVNPKTRTIGVRVEMNNPEGTLRPGDYAETEILIPVTSRGFSAKVYDKALAGKYICPMHPQVVLDEPGKCSICGMDTIKSEKFGFAEDAAEQDEFISVPRNAVLRVGKTSVVYIEDGDGRFSIREIQTGATVGGSIVVTGGLDEFDTIAADGVFLLDSQMQLSGKTSLIDVSAKSSKTKNK